MTTRLVCLLLLWVVAVACNGGEPTATTVAEPLATTVAEPVDSTVDEERDDDPLDARLAFLTDVLNGAELSEADYVAAFAGDFIEAVPYAEFMGLVDQVRSVGADWRVAEFEAREERSATVLLAPAEGGEPVRAQISLEPAAPYRIQGLRLQPVEPPTLDEAPHSLESAADRLGELGAVRVVAAEVGGDGCTPFFEGSADQPAPIGSAFKLYVLGAVADAVAAGTIAWDDPVEISEELKSVPTGVLQHEEAGTEFSVREMAEAMIALSDNTATDHLIELVGRETVEAALSDYGMQDPGLNIPLLNTRELTALKIGPASGLATQWVDADAAGRRRILRQISDITPADLPVAEFTEPVLPEQIEWFASPLDMCRVLAELWEMGEPVTDILTINPGLPDEEGLFDTIAFKGGSEPGVVAMNWLVETPDGRRLVLAGSVVDSRRAFDQLEATLLFGAMRDLLASP